MTYFYFLSKCASYESYNGGEKLLPSRIQMFDFEFIWVGLDLMNNHYVRVGDVRNNKRVAHETNPTQINSNKSFKFLERVVSSRL